jgi:hypothetical protein
MQIVELTLADVLLRDDMDYQPAHAPSEHHEEQTSISVPSPSASSLFIRTVTGWIPIARPAWDTYRQIEQPGAIFEAAGFAESDLCK